VISRLCAGELEDYGAMRDFILAKFKLTPTEYKTRFDSAVKRNEETFTLFAARLRSSLRYYLKSHDCMDDLTIYLHC